MIAWRIARAALIWAALGLATGVLLAVVAPLAFGGRPNAVVSGSMEPAIATGDIVVGWPVSPREAEPGDVLTFSDPTRSGRLVTHRLVRKRINGPQAEMVTRGDANEAVERWTVPADGRVGRVAYRVPALGRVALAVRGGPSRIALIGAALLLLASIEVASLLRRRRPALEQGGTS